MKCVNPLPAAVSLIVLLSGCGEGPPQVGTPTIAPAEDWITKPSAEWPQMVLTNEAQFDDRTPLHGASAFLIRTADDRIMAATAKHLLGEAGGVEPEVKISEFDEAIHEWRLYPRTMNEAFVEAEKLGCAELDSHGNIDWLVLTLKKSERPLPATPLRLAERRVQVGETVYLIGCPYSEPDCRQGVYVGKVLDREGDRFRFDLNPPVALPGFSGAPILDKNGHVVGVMTAGYDDKREGNLYLEAGGEDAATVVDLLRQPLKK